MWPVLLTPIFFAATAVCAARASGLLGAVRANWYRILLAVLLLSCWMPVFGWPDPGRAGGWLFLAGGIGFGWGGLCMFQALPLLGPVLSLLLVECLAAIAAALFSWVVLGAALTDRQMFFLLLTLGGVVLALGPQLPPGQAVGRERWRGLLWAVSAALGQGLSFTLSRHAFTLAAGDQVHLSPLQATYLRLLGGALLAALFWLSMQHRLPRRPTLWQPWSGWATTPWVWVILNTLCGPVIGVTCMLWAISLVENPGLVQAVAATSTLFSLPLSTGLPTPRRRRLYFLGTGLALLGNAGLLLHL